MVFDDVASPSFAFGSLGGSTPEQPAATPLSERSLARWSRAVAVLGSAQEACADPDSDMADQAQTEGPQRLGSLTLPMTANARDPERDATHQTPPETAHQEEQSTEVMQALSLSALRGLHANHRAKVDASNAVASTVDNSASQKSMPTVALADVSALSLQSGSPAQTATPSDGTTGSSNPAEQLQSLVESCCNRLWVSDGAGGIPQGVMLDLGRWMPGCTIEVAKAAGVLRITLRGVDEGRRWLLDQELLSLGDALAQKLGCQVVAAVEAQKESP
jgi:hypothetical protein